MGKRHFSTQSTTIGTFDQNSEIGKSSAVSNLTICAYFEPLQFDSSEPKGTLESTDSKSPQEIWKMTPMRRLAHWIFTQRTIRVVLPKKAEVLRHEKPFPTVIKTIGDLLMARRKEAGMTREKLSITTDIQLYWLGRWERDRSLPPATMWNKLSKILRLSANPGIGLDSNAGHL
jgi:hypothetical protein